MAPACVLLERGVTFRDHPAETEEEAAPGVMVVGGGTIAAPPSQSRRRPTPEEKEAAIIKYLRAMQPDIHVVDPPGVTCLTMVRPHSSDPAIPQYGRNLDSGFAAAAHKSLVVVRAGPSYSGGWYLVLDLASSSSSSPRSSTVIPGISSWDTNPYKSAGFGTVITPLLQGGGGAAFILARLLFRPRRPAVGLTSGMLCLWDSRTSSWVRKVADLPAQVCHAWRVHRSFPVQTSRKNLLCWADLLHGLLLWDLDEASAVHSDDLRMSFVPLPPDCREEYDQLQRLPNPEDSRTMACVNGSTIKFIAMDDTTPTISLVTYTLHDLDGPASSSSPSWTKDTVMRLDDLWADETYISMGLPRITPSFPILSTQEHDVVYLAIPSDVELVDGFRSRRVLFVLSVDTRETRLISATQENLPGSLTGSRQLIAFDADPQLGSNSHHQRAVEAIGMGPSRKRIRFGDLRN